MSLFLAKPPTLILGLHSNLIDCLQTKLLLGVIVAEADEGNPTRSSEYCAEGYDWLGSKGSSRPDQMLVSFSGRSNTRSSVLSQTECGVLPFHV